MNGHKLQLAKLKEDPVKCALSCLFAAEELVNGSPSGITKLKDQARINSIQKLDADIMKYIKG